MGDRVCLEKMLDMPVVQIRLDKEEKKKKANDEGETLMASDACQDTKQFPHG
jgi:hypothetical protein